MQTIWKYPIDTTDEQTVKMPCDAEILCVQMQCGQPCLWALVDPEKTTAPVKIRIYGTGHPLPDIWGDYVGTYQSSGGGGVFHVFRVH